MRHHGNDEMSAAAVWDPAIFDQLAPVPAPFTAAGRWQERWQEKLSRRLARYVVTKRVWARNERPLVSFSFDDVPDQTYLHGAPVLEDFGARGTFYVAGGLCGLTDMDRRIISAAQCVDLHRRGHEIGCHTFSHAAVASLDGATLSAELDRNQAYFASLAPDLTLDNFAYPYGSVSIPRKLQAQRRFHSCRGVREGINVGTVDLGMLKAMAIDQSTKLARITGAIDEASRGNGWLILFTHDVAPAPTSIGCTPALLRAVIEHALGHGCEIVTVREGLRRIGSEVGAVSP